MPVVRLLLSAPEKKALTAALAMYHAFCDMRAPHGSARYGEHAHHALEILTRLTCAPVLAHGDDGLDGPWATLVLQEPECAVFEDAVAFFMAECNEQRSAPDFWDHARMRHRAGRVVERLWQGGDSLPT